MSTLATGIVSRTLSVAPKKEPVTLEEAKLHLRVEHTVDDDLIAGLLKAARQHAEGFMNRAFVSQTWIAYLDTFPASNEPIALPLPPLQSVTTVAYTDTAGSSQTLTATTDYLVDTDREPGRIHLAFGKDWPATRGIPNGVAITYVAGYGDAAETVPEDIKAGIKLLVAHWYETRVPVVMGAVPIKVPMSVQALLSRRRVMWGP